MTKHADIDSYHAAQDPADGAICDALRALIDEVTDSSTTCG